MKLFVDDYRPAPPGWTWAKNVSEAIRLMDNQPIEALALDHDIKDSTETFEPVARHFAILVRAEVQQKTTPISIHTGNPVGGERMLEILTLAGCIDVAYASYSSYLLGDDER